MSSANPILTATQGKGVWNMIKRTTVIGRRYGLTSRNMDATLRRFAEVLSAFEGKATFPITGAALARSESFAQLYQSEQIEFAAHGYFHVDHLQLTAEEQITQLAALSQLFQDQGIEPTGFRCPYLRWSNETLDAVKQAGFQYDSSQALVWPAVTGSASDSYHRVLEFYGANAAQAYPALPRWDKGLLRIPYCLPDDEALIDRFTFTSDQAMNEIWLDILEETYQLGELFTLGLHPERFFLCEAALTATLRQARGKSPAVWFARLDEIARWWQARRATKIVVEELDGNSKLIKVSGPIGVTVLVRGLAVGAELTNWDSSYQLVNALEFNFECSKRPFIGVSPQSAAYVSEFLRQQGFIVESATSAQEHSIYVDMTNFEYEDERLLLAQIEHDKSPLIRLGRWPDGARSSLCITGDIDALTIWDYGLRFLGN